MRVKKIFLIATLLTFVFSTAKAQLDISVVSAEIQCPKMIVSVTFNKSLTGLLLDAQEKVDKASAESKKHFESIRDKLEAQIKALSSNDVKDKNTMYLLSLDGKMTKLTAAVIPLATKNNVTVDGVTGFYDVTDTIEYSPAAGFDPSKGKYLFMMTKAAKNPSMVPLNVSKNCETVKAELPAPTYQPEYKPAKPYNDIVEAVTVKDEATVFADFAFDSRKKNNAADTNTHSFTGNLSFVPVRIKKIGFAGHYEIQPFFYELKVNDKGDENSYISNFGAKIRHIRVFGDDGHGFNNDRNNRFLPGLVTDLTAKIETNDFFDGINVVGEIKPTLPINVYQSRARLLRFDPFVGFTFGRKVKDSSRSETQIPRGTLSRLDWISRPMAGFDLTYSEFRDRIIKPTLTLGYTIRWPLQAEDIYGKSADGNNKDIFLGQSRLPRNYYNAKISLDLGTIVTPFIGYESGRLPPDYKFISGQMKIGFSVKFKRK